MIPMYERQNTSYASMDIEMGNARQRDKSGSLFQKLMTDKIDATAGKRLNALFQVMIAEMMLNIRKNTSHILLFFEFLSCLRNTVSRKIPITAIIAAVLALRQK